MSDPEDWPQAPRHAAAETAPEHSLHPERAQPAEQEQSPEHEQPAQQEQPSEQAQPPERGQPPEDAAVPDDSHPDESDPQESDRQESDPDGADTTAREPIIRATKLSLDTRHGTVFTDVSLTLEPDRLGIVCGPSGSGRSALLLALCGRMRGLTGELRVAGFDGIGQARRVRAISAPARVSTLVDLEGQLTVADSITERSLIDGLHPRTGAQAFATIAADLGLEVDRDQLVDSLPAPETTLLAVALACLRRPRLLLLDDLDRGLDLAQQSALIATLSDLAATGVTVVATTTDPTPVPAGAVIHSIDPPRTDPPRTDPPRTDPPRTDPEEG